MNPHLPDFIPSLRPSDYENIFAAAAKRRKKLEKWRRRFPNSSEREAASNPRHARMLALTDPAKEQIPIPLPTEPYPDHEIDVSSDLAT